MDAEASKLEQLIKNAQKILITSHISPDPDAVSSLLLLGTTIKFNYSDKTVQMVLEEQPFGLNSLSGHEDIGFGSIVQALNSYRPDLFILLDGNNYSRV